MPVDIILTRQSTFKINTGTDATPTWVAIGGLTNLNYSLDESVAEGNHFGSGGWNSSLVSRRGVSFSLDAMYLVDAATGARDPGQEAVELSSRQIGTAGLKSYQFADGSTGGKTITFKAHATATYSGGGVDDNAGWTATVTATGAPTFA
jgi:hypothetical protein